MTEHNIFFRTGDIQFSTCQTIVVPVNCDGMMKEGIAASFRRRYPPMFKRYQWLCEQQLLSPGKLWIYTTPTKRKILCFPIGESVSPSCSCIEMGLEKFLGTYQEKGITSVAFPLFSIPSANANEILGLMSYYLCKCNIGVEIYTEYIPRSVTLIPLLERICGKLSAEDVNKVKKSLCFEVD